MTNGSTLAPGLEVLALTTPTLPPATATNTLVVGQQRLLVIEPATPFAEQQATLWAYLEQRRAKGAEVAGIAITHHHIDHIGYAHKLRQQLGVPLYAHAETASRVDFPIDHLLEDGDEVELDAHHRVRAVFTPGHAPGHLVFVDLPTGTAHAGDLVAGIGTILIDPDDAGDMRHYLASLERLRQLDLRALVPAHGPVIEQPDSCLRHFIAHRLLREQRVIRALERGARDLSSTLADCYSDTPQALRPLAMRSLRAHLDKLEFEHRIARTGDRVKWLG